MSLALIQSYSSVEEKEEEESEAENHLHDSSDDEKHNHHVSDYASKPLFKVPKPLKLKEIYFGENGDSSSSSWDLEQGFLLFV
ncbi:hypothetical protein ACSBR1_014951 [Camellia fascicularis]